MIRLALLLSLLSAPAFAQTVRDIANRGACSTAGLEGISAQLAEAQRCQNPGAFVRFAPHPGVSLSSSRIHPYLQASARDALHRAAARSPITINSAFRTLADQYVLYHSGGCGLAARPGQSNHQSGRALDVQNYSAVRSILQSEGCTWLGSRDPVHFDCPGSDRRGQAIMAFQKLWNLNNPGDRIDEDGVYGPQTESRLARTPAGGFATDGCTAEPPPPPPPSGGRLIGVVYEGDDLEARVAGATVQVVETGATMTADGTGLWEFEVPAGEYTVQASADGFVMGSHRCTVATGDTWCSVSIARGAAMGVARGVVHEAGDVEARIAAARVMVTETGAGVTADDEGNWSVELAPGTYHLAISASGYSTGMTDCVVRAGEESECALGLSPEALTGSLQGAIFEGDDLARRVIGATVTVLETGASAVSREGDGIFRIEVGEGTWTVEASGDGFESNTRSCTVRAGEITWCSVGIEPLDGGESPLLVEEVDDIDDIGDDDIVLRRSGTVKTGCSAGGNGSTGALILLGVLAMRRRRQTLV